MTSHQRKYRNAHERASICLETVDAVLKYGVPEGSAKLLQEKMDQYISAADTGGVISGTIPMNEEHVLEYCLPGRRTQRHYVRSVTMYAS